MKYTWQTRLIHNLEPMDSEYKLIIEQLDNLYDAIINHSSDEAILDTMSFLEKYDNERLVV